MKSENSLIRSEGLRLPSMQHRNSGECGFCLEMEQGRLDKGGLACYNKPSSADAMMEFCLDPSVSESRWMLWAGTGDSVYSHSRVERPKSWFDRALRVPVQAKRLLEL